MRISAALMRTSFPKQSRVSLVLPTTSRTSRTFASFIDFDEELESWPITKANTFLNVCPQGKMMVVERFGKLHEIKESGLFVAIPFIDNIRFVLDMREKALSIAPQSTITKDNVHVHVSGNLYCQFVDPERAAYGSKNPIYAVKQHAQSSMRAAIGELELDEMLHAREKLNKMIKSTISESAQAWGIDIKRYEITTITPDKFITDAMAKQAAAERDRRKKLLEAEGDKRSAELESEGLKIRLKNESEGTLIKIANEAEANRKRLILEGEGEVAVIKMRAAAQAEAIKVIADALNGSNASDAAKLAVAKEYIKMYSDIGQKSNTMIFADRPADINSLMAQAATVVKSLNVPPATESITAAAASNAGNGATAVATGVGSSNSSSSNNKEDLLQQMNAADVRGIGSSQDAENFNSRDGDNTSSDSAKATMSSFLQQQHQ